MKPGDLRLMHGGLFIDKTSRVFIVLPWSSRQNIAILMDGEIDRHWDYQTLLSASRPINETQ